MSGEQKPVKVLIVTPQSIGRILIKAVLLLLLVYMATQLAGYLTGHFSQFGLAHLVNLDHEANIPTWFSSSLLLICALLLGLIGLQGKQRMDLYANYWLGLSAIFIFLSMDEAAGIHDLTSRVLRPTLNISEGSYWGEPWVIPYVFLLLIVGLIFARFLIVLPSRTRWGFVLAGSAYVGGALGVEMVRATTYPYDPTTLSYILAGLIEEGMEMGGLVIFVCVLLSYMASEMGEIRIIFHDKNH